MIGEFIETILWCKSIRVTLAIFNLRTPRMAWACKPRMVWSPRQKINVRGSLIHSSKNGKLPKGVRMVSKREGLKYIRYWEYKDTLKN